MDSATRDIGVHWENGEPAILFKSRRKDSARHAGLASVTALRSADLPPGTNRLRYADLKQITDIEPLFLRLDELLHRAGSIREARHTILLKLLLVKLYDEERVQEKENHGQYMLIQDFSAVDEAWNGAVERTFTSALHAALGLYNGVLAQAVPRTIGCSAEVLREASGILCDIRLLGALPQVIQDLFMYFGRFHYRVDLGQYFTPCEVIRLIVEIVNPRRDDRIVDPACGTADFLVGAKQVASERHGADISAHLHGYDIAPLAVHLSIFNMLLNGDRGLADIETRDTLLEPLEHEGHYQIALCNPPFGARIVEKRAKALNRFNLVSVKKSGLGLMPKAQEAGLLYVETCLRAVAPGGRVGILVPNGYLGNRSERYCEFRRWIHIQEVRRGRLGVGPDLGAPARAVIRPGVYAGPPDPLQPRGEGGLGPAKQACEPHLQAGSTRRDGVARCHGSENPGYRLRSREARCAHVCGGGCVSLDGARRATRTEYGPEYARVECHGLRHRRAYRPVPRSKTVVSQTYRGASVDQGCCAPPGGTRDPTGVALAQEKIRDGVSVC